jgi:hypothetical protein
LLELAVVSISYIISIVSVVNSCDWLVALISHIAWLSYTLIGIRRSHQKFIAFNFCA